MTDNVKVAVALLCYNNLDLLKQFLPEVLDTIPADGSCKLVVIDNASTDGTNAYLKSFGQQIELVTIAVNKGFTNGYKLGLANVNAEIICLLSADVQISSRWIEPVMAMFDHDAKVAVVQPVIKSWHDKSMFEYAGAAGGYIDYLGFPFCRGRIFYTTEKDHNQYASDAEIFWASGACFFIRGSVFKESGGLDDDFFAHMEEIDLCWRIKNKGYKVMVCTSSVVYHIGGSVIAYGSPEKTYRNHRNNLIMMTKNLPNNELIWKILVRLILDALAFGNMIIRGQIRASFAIIAAHWNYFYHLPKWLHKRRENKNYAVPRNLSCIYPKSVVAAYFLRGQKTFNELNWFVADNSKKPN